MKRAVSVILSVILLTIMLAAPCYALPANPFMPKDSPLKSGGFIGNEKLVNSTTPILLGKWTSWGVEYQEFGYLHKTYNSYFYDQSYSQNYSFTSSQTFPKPMDYTTGTVKTKSLTGNISGSIGGKSGALNGQLSAALTATTSVSNSIQTGTKFEAKWPGVWRVAGFYMFDTQEFKAYTVKWDKRQNKFVPYKSGYTVIIHKPFGYVVQEQFLRAY